MIKINHLNTCDLKLIYIVILSICAFLLSVKPEGAGPFSEVVDNKYPNAVFNWLAPEVMAGQPVTEKSDLYSLCAVMWEILNGENLTLSDNNIP